MIKEYWTKLSEANRRRIMSFLTTFATSFVVLLAAQVELGFPSSWTALGAVIGSVARSALREAIILLAARLNGK